MGRDKGTVGSKSIPAAVALPADEWNGPLRAEEGVTAAG